MKNPGLHPNFESHTDSTCLETRNQKLSEIRAGAFMKYVLQRGVPADRVTWIGNGQTMAWASNDNKEVRALKRRIENNAKKSNLSFKSLLSRPE